MSANVYKIGYMRKFLPAKWVINKSLCPWSDVEVFTKFWNDVDTRKLEHVFLILTLGM